MSNTLVIAQPQRLWGTFDEVRERLFDQFRNVPYRAETGVELALLRREVEGYLRAHQEQPRVLQKANVFRIVATRGQICIDPIDWFAGKLNHGGIVQSVREGWFAQAKRFTIKDEADWCARAYACGGARAGIDMGHISPGWEHMFAGGLTGLIERARRHRERLGADATDAQIAFYEAVEIVHGAAITLSKRFADLAHAMAFEHPEYEERLRCVAEACRRVPAQGPRTFHEALQFAWTMHELIEMEGELVRSMGHFDRTMYPYYRADIEAGRLTREQAKELIKFLWIKYYARTRGRQNGKNFLFGGQHADGTDDTNELTYVALEAYEQLNTPDPKLSVRFFPGTPDALYRRVADLIRRGHNSFVLMNDEPAIAGLLKRGKTLPDARLYLPIGCYEPAVDGKEAGCTMNIVINLAKGVELALHDGVDPLSGEQFGPRTGDPTRFRSFGEMFEAYRAQMDWLVTRAIECTGAHERAWPQINPSPLIAATIDDCLARGKDVGEGGPHYNSVGCVALGLANAGDSLFVLKRAVFEEKRFTMADVVAALDGDFEGAQPMREYLRNRIPKWGNNDAETDAIVKRVADWYCAKVHSFTNARGGPCQAALFSLDHRVHFGKTTGALPDGRRARESVAPNVGPMPGLDKEGVTALIGSVTKLDFSETPNGSVLDVMLHPSAVRGPEGLDAFVALIKTFIEQGGYALQFNVVDARTLRDAQRHPERYATLQIRVTGWSAYFVTLSKADQDQFIARTFHSV